MSILFDEIIDRANTGSAKWDPSFLKEHFGHGDLLPLWVADMDFKAPQSVIDALVARAEHGIYGYTIPDTEKYYSSIINWFKRRHNWTISKNWIEFSPGIVPACIYIIQRFTKPGDKIIIQNPVYYPFKKIIESNGRTVLSNQLKLIDSRYHMNFDELAEQAKDPRAKILILCNPHNPVGRVWSKEELVKLGNICIENNVLVLADEIHCDLIYPGYSHTSFASISEKFAQHSITCTAGSKTFNLAGLKTSNVIIPNKNLRDNFRIQMENHFMINLPSVFGALALQVAYDTGEAWLDSLIQVLAKHVSFLKQFITENIPKIIVIEPEGTYLVWLDFKAYNLNYTTLEKKILEEAKLALDQGYTFGAGGEGFVRINIACPRSILEEGLNRLARVFA